MFRLLAFSIIFIVALSGCATGPTREAFDQQAQQWIGRNADELVIKKGPPTSTFTLGNGNRVFQYDRSEDVIVGGTYPMPTTIYIPGGPVGGSWVQGQTAREDPLRYLHLTCSVRYIVDTGNTIIAWSRDGNDCVARPEAGK